MWLFIRIKWHRFFEDLSLEQLFSWRLPTTTKRKQVKNSSCFFFFFTEERRQNVPFLMETCFHQTLLSVPVRRLFLSPQEPLRDRQVQPKSWEDNVKNSESVTGFFCSYQSMQVICRLCNNSKHTVSMIIPVHCGQDLMAFYSWSQHLCHFVSVYYWVFLADFRLQKRSPVAS